MNRLVDTPALDAELQAVASALRAGTFLLQDPADPRSVTAPITVAHDRAIKLADRLEALLRHRHPSDRLPDSVRDYIEGMEVSVDVSTGDDDAGHRYFGTVTEVMDESSGKHGVILLVQNPTPNFNPTAAGGTPVKLAEREAPSPAGDVLIAIRRGEAYEDVHPELVVDDFVNGAGRGFSWRLLETPDVYRLPPLPDPWFEKKRGPDAGVYFNAQQMHSYGRIVYAQAIDEMSVAAADAPAPLGWRMQPLVGGWRVIAADGESFEVFRSEMGNWPRFFSELGPWLAKALQTAKPVPA